MEAAPGAFLEALYPYYCKILTRIERFIRLLSLLLLASTEQIEQGRVLSLAPLP
jgi:hypothetical protein